MPTKTNLDYVQDILSALDSDEVNSVSDSTESQQVLRILKRAYDGIVNRADLNEHYTLFELTPSNDSTKPTIMYRPENIDSIIWVKYNKATATNTNKNFQEVTFLDMNSFLQKMYMIKEDQDHVISYSLISNTDNIKILGVNNKSPTWFTTFDDHTLIFDSYDAGVDSTLQNDKSLAYGKKDPSFLMTDTFVPFLDVEFGTLLLNEALVLSFSELKQLPHEVAKQWANRAWTKTNKSKRGIDQDIRPISYAPNYGRRRY